MISSYTEYLAYDRTYDMRVTSMLVSGQVRREVDYFIENIGDISTGDELVDDTRLYRFVMTAFDLESQIFARGLIRKLFEEGIQEPTALANRLTDQKFKTLAKAFAFAEVGDFNVKNPQFIAAVVERYTAVTVEQRAGEENIAVRLGLYFDRKVGAVSNWYAVLADTALREVALTGLGFPPEVNGMNVDRLVQRLEERFNIEDLKDDEKRGKLIQRFTLLYDMQNNASSVVASQTALFPVLGADGGRPQIIAIDPSTLSAITRFS